MAQVGKPTKLEVDLIVGADGANSRVAKEIGAGEYDYAIAFQVRLVWKSCAGDVPQESLLLSLVVFRATWLSFYGRSPNPPER